MTLCSCRNTSPRRLSPRVHVRTNAVGSTVPAIAKTQARATHYVGAFGAAKALGHQPLLLLGNLECGTASVGAGLVSAGRGCAVEFAGAVGDQTGLRTCAVGTGAERV